MPDCAPALLGLVEGDDDPKWKNPKRRWKAVRDFGGGDETPEDALKKWRERLKENDGQLVVTFVADHWTLEYDLAFCGLAEEVYVAASLAKNDDPLNEEKKKRTDVEATAREEFKALETETQGDHAALCSQIYRMFHSGGASKAIGAQYLAELLIKAGDQEAFDKAAFAKKLPRYIVDAVTHVMRPAAKQAPAPPAKTDGHA